MTTRVGVPRKPDKLVDQVLGYLARRAGQTVTDEFIGEFMTFFFRRKKQSDLLLMRDMVKGKEQLATQRVV